MKKRNLLEQALDKTVAKQQQQPTIHLNLVGIDGNAFAILGAWRTAARRAGWPQASIEEVTTEAQSGDYDHLLQTIMDNCESPEDGD